MITEQLLSYLEVKVSSTTEVWVEGKKIALIDEISYLFSVCEYFFKVS